MTIPAYLETFRQAVRELQERRGKSEISGKSPTLIPLNPLIPHLEGSQNPPDTLAKVARAELQEREKSEISEKRVRGPYAAAFLALGGRCPDHIPAERWRRCLDDASTFLQVSGEQAATLGWTAEELFGLHQPPANPHPSYNRLSRYECTGLIWGLEGRRVVALTEQTAAVEGFSGNITIYRKTNKPAYGPFGDSLDDFIA